MIRILFVIHTGKLGGPANSLLKLLDYMPSSYSPTVVMPAPGDLAKQLAQKGVNFFYNTLQLRSLPSLIYSVIRGKYHVVYANNFSYRSNIGLFAAILSHRPFIWHIREMVRSENFSRKCLRFSSAVIAVSQACADLLKKDVPFEKLHVIHNGIDLDDFGFDREQARQYIVNEFSIVPDRILVMSVGHVCERKNQLEVVEIAARLVGRFPGLLFCFLGRQDHSPEYFSQVKQRVHELGIEEHFIWTGFRTDVANLLQGADIFLHVSKIDPHPRSVIEAMAARLPVVAYQTDGVPETVTDGQTGFLAGLGRRDSLIQALSELAANPMLRSSMGEKGRERVEQLFTASRTAREISQLVDDVLAKRS